ncbi:3-deoxy-7-phosphoheptulonate synthase [Thamnidium elegans]|nr:3-deoxy-7-phosphoheptulonate synthase [Thamnidium elegans]
MATLSALNELDDKRIARVRPLIPPQIIMEDLPLNLKAAETILKGRQGAENIIMGLDDRLLAVVGPCSIHNVKAGLEYAKRLLDYAENAKDDLHIIMRGLRTARQFLLNVNEMGIPAGCEFLDAISPQYTGDLVSWGAIGARTTESQVHRELASGLSCPVGFKNGTDGSMAVAMDAIKAASHGHHFLSVTKQGVSAIIETTGNDSCHVILRGGKKGPNYSTQHIKVAAIDLEKKKLRPIVMVDCSHGNSSKDHNRQPIVAKDISKQLANPLETGNNIIGVMIESNLVEGRQDIPPEGPHQLVYGKSITDACINWEDTIKTLNTLREGVRARRTALN